MTRTPVRPDARPRASLLLPALSGLLLSLSLPPWPVALLAPVALAPLGVQLLRLPRTRSGSARAALAGAVTGAVHGILTLHWLPGAALPILGGVQAGAAALVVWGAGAAFIAAAAWTVHRAMVIGGLPLPLGMGAAWVLLGWLPTLAPVVGFPWLGPEAALVEHPIGLGVADLVGGAGVAGLLAFCGGALASGVEGRLAWPAGAAAVVGAALLYGGAAEARWSGRGPAVRVAALSLDADPGLLADSAARTRVLSSGLARLSGLVESSEIDLVLWPESPTGASDGRAEIPLALEASRTLRRPILFGVMVGGTDERPSRRNRLLRADPEGSLTTVHEKRRLVPGVEWRPGGGSAGVRSGPRRPPFPVPYGYGAPPRSGAHEVPAGALICFEALFPGEARRLRREGARVLFLPSNEGWLSGRGGGLLDAARSQHRAAAVLRAVEVRMPVVRSAVGGPAGAWDPGGRRIEGEVRQLGGVGRVLIASVQVASPRVPIGARGGAGGVALAALGLLAFGLLRAGRARRRWERRPSFGE